MYCYGPRVGALPAICFAPLDSHCKQKIQEYVNYEYYEREREARCYLIARIFKVAMFGTSCGKRVKNCTRRTKRALVLNNYDEYVILRDKDFRHKKILKLFESFDSIIGNEYKNISFVRKFINVTKKLKQWGNNDILDPNLMDIHDCWMTCMKEGIQYDRFTFSYMDFLVNGGHFMSDRNRQGVPYDQIILDIYSGACCATCNSAVSQYHARIGQ